MKPMLRTVLAVILAGLLSSAAQAGDGMERTLLLLETLDCTIAATRPQMTPGETQEALAAKASEVLASKCAGRLNAYARAVEKGHLHRTRLGILEELDRRGLSQGDPCRGGRRGRPHDDRKSRGVDR